MRRRHPGTVLVTGACGHVGRHLCAALEREGIPFVPVDVAGECGGVVACDLTRGREVARLFGSHAIRTVVHLAGVLPGAFRSDPLRGAEVNLAGSVHLLREAVRTGTGRFLFASSVSVYGSARAERVTEESAICPDEPYGASKRAIELTGEALADAGTIGFLSLRIARIIGPGIRQTSSPWRAEILDRVSRSEPVRLPYGPDALLSLVHAGEVARMLTLLVRTAQWGRSSYNAPAEIWLAGDLKEVIQKGTGTVVELLGREAHAGPVADGAAFARDFGFRLRGVREYLSSEANA